MTKIKQTEESGPLRGSYAAIFSLLFGGAGYCIGALTGYGSLKVATILGVAGFVVIYVRLGFEEEFS